MSIQKSRLLVPPAGFGKTARNSHRFLLLTLSVFLAVCLATPTLHAEQSEETADQSEAATNAETDQKSDGDEAMNKKGPPFIAIPIFITEPAVGYGLGAAVGYFHKQKKHEEAGGSSHTPVMTADTASEVGRQQKVPPTISGIAGAYTENGTYGVGFAHTASWKKDRIRYTGVIGYAHVVSTFYFNDEPAEFKLDTGLLLQDIKFRIKSSDFFVGGKLVYLSPELLFDEELPDVQGLEDKFKLKDVGLAIQADYDLRDNKMTPNHGQYVEFVA